MKKVCLYLTALALCVLAVSCSKDQLSSTSVIQDPQRTANAFDLWLGKNYVEPYNIEIQYRMVDIESHLVYHLVPAEYRRSVHLARLLHFLCIVPYDSVTGSRAFARATFPKYICFVGSAAHNNNGTIILGTAEDGIKVVMYNVNTLNAASPTVGSSSYFKTMHHELGHILNQRKPYTRDFRAISGTSYVQDDWSLAATPTSHPDTALTRGFISSYAAKDDGEDFVELFSIYITSSETQWNALMTRAGATRGRPIINAKLDIVYNYMLEDWGVDMDELRRVIQVNQGLLPSLDLDNLD